MIAPHINARLIQTEKQDPKENANTGEKKLYLVPATNSSTNEERTKIQMLEEQVRQSQSEIARLHSLLLHKEQLLQNFHVREQELKAALFRRQPAGEL